MDIKDLKNFVEKWLADNGDCFLVDLRKEGPDSFVVEIDSPQSVDIDFCVELSRAIEEEFPREPEDYDLEVGSAGLTSPLRVPAQYIKHLGHELEILTTDGRKLHAVLRNADENGVTLQWSEKKKVEGQKKPVEQTVEEALPYSLIKRAVWDLKI